MIRGSSRTKSTPTIIGAVLAAVWVLTSSAAQAEESAYCKRVHARAAADAALLIAPKALAEGVKVPAAIQQGARLDLTTPGSGYQVRAGLTFSAVAAYKGFGLIDVADADCAQSEQVRIGTEIVAQAADVARLGALRRQAAYLDSRKELVDDLEAKLAERQSAQTVTVPELVDVRDRVLVLRRERMELGNEIARLEASHLQPFSGSLSELVRKIEATTMHYEREVSHVRSLDAWDFAITGGYIPEVLSQPQHDFFGVVQISYSLGGPWHTAAESRYLNARQEEVRGARYELAQQISVLRRQLRATVKSANEELEVLDRRIAQMKDALGRLENADASSAPPVRARIEIELLRIGGDRVFLTELARAFSRLDDN